MLSALRVLICLVFSLAFTTAATAQEKSFTHTGVQADAKRYETYLKTNWQPGNRQGRELRAEGNRLLAGATDYRSASRAFAQAVVFDANDTEAWLGLARALLAINPDRTGERYDLPVNASGAAWNAYERAQTPAAKAAGLVVLHDALKRRSYFRPAIDALKASLALVDAPEVRDALERLVAEHGFRIAEYKVDTEAALPRLCIQFTERLAPGQVDWAQYFKVDGRDPQAVNAEAQQICIDGFAHGKRYEVQVRAGLPSAIAGETLIKTAELAVYVKDRPASVRATGRGYVLPNRGQQGIPLVTVNTDKVQVEVYRIGDRSIAQVLQSGDFQKQVSSYEISNLKERSGAQVYSGELEVASRLNEDVTTAFPIADAIPKLQPGVYVLSANATAKKGEDNGGRSGATQWFVVSDLGLTAVNGDDGIHAFVRSLATAVPVVNANVRLLARNNEVLGTAKTDSRGYVRFDPGLQRGEGGQAPAVLVAETPAGDYAFLDMATAAFDLTDRGVKGRTEPGPVDAFAYTDRGVYRPGESVHLTALIRSRSGSAAGVPVTLIFSRPDGVEHSRVALTDQGLGGRAHKLALAGSAMTGTWRVKVHTDPKAAPIAQAAFLVEDFVPERLELKLEAATAALSPQEPGTIKVAGRYLYGPPAAGLSIEGEITVRPSHRDIAGFAGFQFGLADEQLSPVRKQLEKLPPTNADGKADIAIELPVLVKTSRPLEADLIVRLRESGGRTIERTITVPVDMKSARIGIRPMFRGQVGDGESARFEVVVLGPDGKAVAAKDLKWELLRLDRRWQWYNRDSSWAYEPVTNTRRVAAGTAESAPGAPAKIEARPDWGRYRLEVSDGTGLISSVVFNAGYYADESADSPEVLDVALDKPSYRAGETARVKITSRMAGRALIAVLNSGLASTQEVDLPVGGGEVAIRVSEAWNPGAYVAVMLYRPMDEKAKRMPSRAVGLRWLAIDQGGRTIGVSLDAPEKVKSGGKLIVPVKLTGLSSGEEARVTIAATDVGILNLTRFEAPKPDQWFFGQRRLGSEIRDLYGRLIDGMRAERGKLRSGGDGSGGMAVQGSPPVEATLALFSGIVQVGADGKASVEFQLPDFNGPVRLTAVAWSADKVGSASKDVIVRDPVAMTVSAPRFLTLGDEARLELALHNVEGQAGTYKVTGQYEARARQPGPGRLRALGGDRRGRAQARGVPAQADRGGSDQARRARHRPGRHRRAAHAHVRRQGAGRRHQAHDDRHAGAQGRQGHALQRPAARPDPDPHQAHRLGGTAGALDVPGILAALDRYPYGCAEQTVSRALPLLYVNAVAKRIGIVSDAELRERIDGAIARVLEMQDSSGAFGVWGPSDGDMWLTSFVTDFLTRAKETGYAVRQQPFNQALDRLANYISYAQDFEKGGEARAYALYVLARNGRAPIGELRYYVDTKLDNFATPLAQAQLGAALAMMGDRPRAERAFQGGVPGHHRQRRRRDAARLRQHAPRPGRAHHPGGGEPARQGRDAAAGRARGQGLRLADLHLDPGAGLDAAGGPRAGPGGQGHDARHQRPAAPGRAGARADGAGAEGGPLAVTNTGDGAGGRRRLGDRRGADAGAAISKGFTIERTYYTLDGKKVDLASADRRHRPAQAERPPGGGAEGGRHRHGRAHPAGGPPAGRPGDREPAAGQLRRCQEPRLAEDHGGAAAHRVPRRPLRGRLRLLRRPDGRRAGAAEAMRQRRSGRQRYRGLHRAGGDAGLLRAPGRHGGGHVPPQPLRPHRRRGGWRSRLSR